MCSGIEAATVAWKPLGWQAAAFAEIEKFPSAVLAYHYPEVPNRGDIEQFHAWPEAAIDLLVGGTPCQSFSVAGLRKGLDDPRGGLLAVYLAIARRYRPRWVVWENVPGVLSIDSGLAFGTLLRGLAELGYGFGYRILDAQYFGLAQRRARVFVVGHLGDWRRAAAVLFERESLSGHPAPRRETGARTTGTLASRTSAGGGLGTDFDCDGGLVHVNEVSRALRAANTATGRLDPNEMEFIAQSASFACETEMTPTLPRNQTLAVHTQMRVRRLTPRECERLQGFSTCLHRLLIRVWFGRDGTSGVRAALCSRSVLTSALLAADAANVVSVPDADVTFWNDQAYRDATAALHVRTSHDARAVRISNRGRSIWSASGAAERSAFPLPTPPDHIAQGIARLALDLVPIAELGRAASQPSISGSSHRESGSWPVVTFGPENVVSASDAASRLTEAMRSTTGKVGRDILNSGSSGATLLSCVLAATTSFIPAETRAASFCDVVLDVESDYTAIPYRGKPAKDGPRYKALGNSMAVPVMRWIGRRIQMVELLSEVS